MRFAPANVSEALKIVRASFPDHPLTGRLAALAFMMQRERAGAANYIPR